MGTTDVDGKTLIEVTDAAAILECSVATIYRLISKDEVEARKLAKSRRKLITLESVERWKRAQGLTKHEMSLKILSLETRVEQLEAFVLQQQGKEKPLKPRPDHYDPEAARALVRRKHKELR